MTTIDIAIPVLNEENYIIECIKSVMNFDIPKNVKTNIFILDGGSQDKTIDYINELVSKYPNIHLLHNHGRIQSCALNMVILEGKGDYIMRLDAHSYYPPDYLKLCLETADRTNADNVGGIFITQPGGESYQASLVQAITTHRFGVGNSDFRLNAKERSVDTVPYGFFKRSIFDQIGWFDERLVRAQDYEINKRIIAAGGVVWINPSIKVYYYNQPNLISFYKKQLIKEAPYNVYLWTIAPYAFTPRHAITGVFTVGVCGGLLLSPLTPFIKWPFVAIMTVYILLALVSSIQQAKRYSQPMHILFLPLCFFVFLFLHGIGLIIGSLKVLTKSSPVQKIKEPWPKSGRNRAFPVR